jgi:hypothetical protein
MCVPSGQGPGQAVGQYLQPGHVLPQRGGFAELERRVDPGQPPPQLGVRVPLGLGQSGHSLGERHPHGDVIRAAQCLMAGMDRAHDGLRVAAGLGQAQRLEAQRSGLDRSQDLAGGQRLLGQQLRALRRRTSRPRVQGSVAQRDDTQPEPPPTTRGVLRFDG